MLPTRTIAAQDPRCYYPVVVRKGNSLPVFPVERFIIVGPFIQEVISSAAPTDNPLITGWQTVCLKTDPPGFNSLDWQSVCHSRCS